MTQDATKQLSDLKPGDKVIVEGTTNVFTGAQKSEFKIISSVAKTRITLASGEKFRIADGKELGASLWTDRWIIPVTSESIKNAFERGPNDSDDSQARDLVDTLAYVCRTGSKLAAAIPHLQAALAALKNDSDDKNHV